MEKPLSPAGKLIREAGLWLARRLGTDVRDSETGQSLGRVLFIPWRGKIHVIGLEAETPLKVHFYTQKRITYWRQEIGFTAAPPPDFPHEPRRQAEDPHPPSHP
jgi:hypothetical protein